MNPAGTPTGIVDCSGFMPIICDISTMTWGCIRTIACCQSAMSQVAGSTGRCGGTPDTSPTFAGGSGGAVAGPGGEPTTSTPSIFPNRCPVPFGRTP